MNDNIEVIYAKRIKAGSLAALIFSGTAMFMLPMCVFFGFLALFGARTVQFNGDYVTGIAGLLLALIYGPVFTGIFGLFAWVSTYLGIRIVGYFKEFKIEYVTSRKKEGA